MLLALLFTLMVTSLVAIAVATMLAGLNKTRTSRDLALALEASDAAYSNALLYANTTGFAAANSPITSPLTTMGTVKWQWKATVTSNPLVWTVTVETDGQAVDRKFSATFNGTKINGYTRDASGNISYLTDNSDKFGNGFFGDTGVTVTGAPDIDGYNGSVGILGSNGTLALGSATVDRIDEWNYTTAPNGRCTGTACTNGTTIKTINSALSLASADAAACHPTNLQPALTAWTASTSGAPVAGTCYSSMTFDTTATYSLTGPVYSLNGVTITGSAKVNTATNSTTASGRNLRVYVVGGAVNQAAGSQFAGGIYAPASTCTINASSTDTLYTTRFLGSAVCNALNISNGARLRYDGGMRLLASSAAAQTIWAVSDYTSSD